MAEDIVKVIKVDAGGAVSALGEIKEATEKSTYSFKTLGEARKYINELQSSLFDLDAESNEYKSTCDEINKVQTKMKEIMSSSSSTVTAAAGSYNALSKEMSELKKQWKMTADESERNEIGGKIKVINEELKSMDTSIGNFQRNVGNYQSAFSSGISEMTDKIEKMNNPLLMAKEGVLSLGKALKSLLLNPVGAAIMVVVGAVKALKEGFESSETATNAWRKGMAALEPVTNAISRVFSSLANIVGDFAGKYIPKASNAAAKFLNTIGIMSDENYDKFKREMDMSVALTEREQQLTERRREYAIKESEELTKISELKSKAAQKDIFTDDQRLAFLTEAIKRQKTLGEEKKKIAEEEYKIAVDRSKLTDNDKKTNDNLAKLKSEYIKVEAETNNSTKELITQRAEIIKSGNARVKNEIDKQLAEERKQAEESEKIKEKELEKIKEIKERTALDGMSSSGREITILKKKYDDELDLLTRYGEDTGKLTEIYQKKIKEIKENEALGDDDVKLRNLDEELSFQSKLADLTYNTEFDKKQKILALEKDTLLEKKRILEEELDNYDISVEKKEEIKNKLEEINNQILENERNTTENELLEIQRKVDGYASYAQSIAGILGQVTDLWQESIQERVKEGKISQKQAEEEFEQSKKVQIGLALISGLSGVAMALSCLFTTKTGPWDLILAATQAASIAVSTAVQISKIKQTKLGSSSSSNSGSATPTSAATAYSPNYSTNITGQSQETSLANAITDNQGKISEMKVYVLEDDINRVGKKVTVRDNEATF